MQQKIKTVLLITFVILFWNDLFGQSSEKRYGLNCPGERIQAHISDDNVFTGEILWFKIYCTSSLFPGEEISSLVFVELVNSENASILRKKILVNHGGALGEFEIPDNLPTGIYFILAYTNWMKNFGELTFFRKEILIINPNQPFINTINNPDSLKKPGGAEVANVANELQVLTDKKKYSTREKVMMKIETSNLTGKVISGDFSVSVSRKEPKMIFRTKNNTEEIKYKDPEKLIYLPDYKGIGLTGKITDPSGNAVPGAFVTASTPASGIDIKGSISDSNGNFHFMLKPEEGERDVVITLPDADTKMSLEESFWNGFRNPPDNLLFALNGEAVSSLREKFAHSQLQNRFKKKYSMKNNPVRNLRDSSVFYSKPFQLIEFGNYINLDSLREYFYELVPSVKFTQRRGEFEISVIDPITLTLINEKPGVFLDGVLYDNFAGIANIPVREIDRMAIVSNTYYYKDFTFGGIIDIHTKKSDFNSVKLLPNMARFIFPMADASEWKFLSPDYSIADSLNRIPDFRYLLYWEPNVRIENSGEVSVHFYTGDVTGNFVVKVVGMYDTGEILQAENEIIVE